MWWWFCLAAAAAGALAAAATPLQCLVEGLNNQPLYSPLPTNLTIRPLHPQWHIDFILRVEGLPSPVVCVKIENTGKFVRVLTFNENCTNEQPIKLDYLSYSLNVSTRNTLEVKMEDDEVFLQETEGKSLKSLKLWNVDAALCRDNLLTAVTEVSGVEACMGCADDCPVHHYASTDLYRGCMGEWQQERLQFNFRSADSSSRLHYEVQCTTTQGMVSRWEAEIKLGVWGETGDWHLVEIEQMESNARVRLNGTLVQDVVLPEPCTSRRVIWLIRGESFSFNWTPTRTERTTEEGKNFPSMTLPDGTMFISMLARIGIDFGVIILVGSIIYGWRYCKLKGNELVGNPYKTSHINKISSDSTYESSTQPPQEHGPLPPQIAPNPHSQEGMVTEESESLIPSPSPKSHLVASTHQNTTIRRMAT